MSGLTELWRQGGAVMPFLVVGLVGLWFALGWRAMTLRSSVLSEAEALLAQRAPTTRAATVLAPLRAELHRFRALATSVVLLAPLLGLLGTVSGMIETFDSLGGGAMYTQSGGIAAGISEALVSTQTGLAVAIPGALLARLLDRRQQRLSEQLDALEAR